MKLLTLAAVTAALLAGSIAALSSPTSAAETSALNSHGGTQHAPLKPMITSALAFDAPLGDDGGISNPQVSCGDDWRAEPKVTWTLTSRDTGEEQTFSGRGGYPNQWFPRVPPGKYRSDLTATCNGVKATRNQKLIVGEKTADTTVSRAEWNQIQVGMTTAQVRQVVGYSGVASPPLEGTISRTYNLMPFWRWSVVVYRDGRVTNRYWNVGHD